MDPKTNDTTIKTKIMRLKTKTYPANESKLSKHESPDTTLSNSSDQGESNDNNNCTAHNAEDTNKSRITQEVTNPKTNDTTVKKIKKSKEKTKSRKAKQLKMK